MKFLRRVYFVNINMILIFILIFINILLLKSNLNIKRRKYEKKYYPVFERMLELQIVEGKIINKNVQLIDPNKRNVSLKDILTNSPKMILFYNDKSCYPCVKDIVKTLESMIDSFKFIENNLVIISDDYYSFSSHNIQTRFNNYKIVGDNLGLINKDINEPFIFFIDTTYVSRMFIIPYYHDNNSIDK